MKSNTEVKENILIAKRLEVLKVQNNVKTACYSVELDPTKEIRKIV